MLPRVNHIKQGLEIIPTPGTARSNYGALRIPSLPLNPPLPVARLVRIALHQVLQ